MNSGKDNGGFDLEFNESVQDTGVPCVVICPGYHGQGIARSLGRLRIPVYGVHSDPHSPVKYSRYWRQNFVWDISAHSARESVDWFLALGRKIGSRPILIPTDDHSCLFVDDNAGELLKAYRFPAREPGLARALTDKKQMYHLCKKHDIPTPETSFPQSREDVLQFISNAAFPVMLKGIDTVRLLLETGVRMVIAKDAETLLSCYDKMESPDSQNLMLQEYIPGNAEDVWMFNGYFDEKSNCLFEITGRKLRQYPAYTGMTSLGICEKNQAVSNLTKRFMKAIGYQGILDIGYKYDSRSDKYYLLDPNPRIGASFRLFVDSKKLDVVRMLYLHFTGQQVVPGALQEGRKWLVEPFDLVSSYRYWRDGALRIRDWVGSFQGVKEAQWFARDDLLPFGMVWMKSLRRAFHRQ